jgi:hypothetical protein
LMCRSWTATGAIALARPVAATKLVLGTGVA